MHVRQCIKKYGESLARSKEKSERVFQSEGSSSDGKQNPRVMIEKKREVRRRGYGRYTYVFEAPSARFRKLSSINLEIALAIALSFGTK